MNESPSVLSALFGGLPGRDAGREVKTGRDMFAPDASWTPIDRQASRLKKMQRSVLTFANIAQRVYPMRKAWMVTLTYRENRMWRREHVADALRLFRKWCDKAGTTMVYAWVMELTKQGRPHYHIVLWLPTGLQCPFFDGHGWWQHGSSNTIPAKFAPGYLAKYVSKGVNQWDADKPVALPRGARMHGTGGLRGVDLDELRYWLMPRWVREQLEYMGQARRMKGGWICKTSGEMFPTPFEVIFSHGMAWCRRKSQALCMPLVRMRPIEEANASSWLTSAWA